MDQISQIQLDQKEPHKGLMLGSPIRMEGSIAAIVGRNGAGKSRLLEAIAEGKIGVTYKDKAVARDQILHLTTERLQPRLAFGFDPVRHRDQINIAKNFYNTHREKFHPDPKQTIARLGSTSGHSERRANPHWMAHVAANASRSTGKDITKLDLQDIDDFYSSAVGDLGSLNVTAIMLEYLQRQQENEFNLFRNQRQDGDFPYWPPKEFASRFGTPPWELFNKFLKFVLDDRYHINPPSRSNPAGYEAKLYLENGKEVDPAHLSSGEKALLWLCLCMYGANSRRVGNAPRLLLLDEPDSSLHPQMIQKLHFALNTLANEFDCCVIFATHSPTTVALFENGKIFQVSDSALLQIGKDAAIGELLVGVDQISIHYTNRRQVYVESYNDAELYATLFRQLRLWSKGLSPHISLSFIAAAPKLSDNVIRETLVMSFGALEQGKVEKFVSVINGQGNCAQVIGTVEALIREGNSTVHGIVDWDSRNNPTNRIHVLGKDLFYSIESAILNPITLGLYLLHNFTDKMDASEYGLTAGYDPLSLYDNSQYWQGISDAVTRRVLGESEVAHDVECSFVGGAKLAFDKRYVQMNGHGLEALIKSKKAYPFLAASALRPSLLRDVVNRGICSCQGRTLVQAIVDMFRVIQSTEQSLSTVMLRAGS